ncbi:hypothetical protein HZA96_02885 [Candidatus Woesearchaeota archaeon]|nr:hypothetical protein [Candidatus Woesearchaeota archaeon]
MKKKSQVQDMMMYILGIVIIGMLLFFGVKYIMKLMKTTEDIDLLQLKTSLETTAKKYGTKYGSWTLEEIPVPKKVQYVCFFDLSKDKPTKENSLICGGGKGGDNLVPVTDKKKIKDPIICDAWKTGKSQNVMTIPFVPDYPLLVEKMKIDDKAGFICFKAIAGEIKVKFTGLGSGVKVSNPPAESTT